MTPGQKDGSVRLQDYELPEYVARLEPVVQRLKAEHGFGMDSKTFAQTIAGILQLMEDAMGRNGSPEYKQHPKLPMTIFRNYAPDGPLFIVGRTCWQHMQAKGVKKIDFQAPNRRRENMELLAMLRQELMKAGLLQNPKVFIDPSCGPDVVPRLQQTVRKLGGEVMLQLDSPAVTHAVYPFGPNGDPDDGKEWMRKLEVRGEHALVHYWYLPDSYDELISAAVAPPDLDTPHNMPGPVKVYVRWLRDSELYNEWMNPLDFWTEEYEKQVEAWEKGRTGQPAMASQVKDSIDAAKRKREPSMDKGAQQVGTMPVLQQKKKARIEEVEPGAGVQLTDGVTKQVLVHPNKGSTDPKTSVEDISQGQRHAWEGAAAVPVARPPQRGSREAPVVPVDQPTEDEPIQPQHTQVLYRVPTYSVWFKWDKVHDVERREVPEFFNDQSPNRTPEVYKEVRNLLINLYRQDMKRRLTFTEARRILAGDASSLMLIWKFLDKWGLINFDTSDAPMAQLPAVAVVPQEQRGNGVRIIALPPAPAMENLFRFPQPTAVSHQAAASTGLHAGRLLLRNDVHGTTATQPPNPDKPVRYFCSAMPWIECTDKRYHCTTLPDVDLCPVAFAEGRFPPGCSEKDFILLEADTRVVSADGWTDQETLLLLEGLEMYGDKWAEIADHVGTKSQLQCVMHFLQLPIEEQFVRETIALEPGVALPGPSNGSNAQNGAETSNAATASPTADQAEAPPFIPFADAGNPVMAQLAFLASMVGPRVAAAAAKAALECLAETEPGYDSDADGDEAAAKADSAGGDAEAEGQPISAKRMQAATATALAGAAVKAKMLAQLEEREVQRLVMELIELQFRKVAMKTKYLDQLETALQKDCLLLESERVRLFKEATELKHRLAAATAAQQPAPQPANTTAAQPRPAQLPAAPATTTVVSASVPRAPIVQSSSMDPAATAVVGNPAALFQQLLQGAGALPGGAYGGQHQLTQQQLSQLLQSQLPQAQHGVPQQPGRNH